MRYYYGCCRSCGAVNSRLYGGRFGKCGRCKSLPVDGVGFWLREKENKKENRIIKHGS